MRAYRHKTAPAPAEKSLRVLACRLETAAKTGAFEHRHEASALPARSKDLASALPTHCTAPRAAIVSPAVLSSGRARLSAGEQFWQEVAHRRALPHERPTPFADRSAQPRASHIGAREAENEPASAHHETAGKSTVVWHGVLWSKRLVRGVADVVCSARVTSMRSHSVNRIKKKGPRRWRAAMCGPTRRRPGCRRC